MSSSSQRTQTPKATVTLPADKIQKIRARAKSDYLFFAKEVLGYSLLREHPHQKVCDHILSGGHRKKLTLMPRGSFKSSLVTVAGSLYALLQNPNERILIASETQYNATKYVREIRGQIEGNQRLRALFGDWVPKNQTWTDRELVVATRKRAYKEPSVMAGSLEKGLLTGMHYSLIILDDVVSKANVNTAEQIQKTLDYYRLLLSILDPDGRIWINGTRWSELDLYGWILEPDNGEVGQFDVIVESADDEDGGYLMPDVLSPKFLAEQKQTQGDYIYNCQYRNRPISPETATIRSEWIKFYETLPDGLIYFITVDPAISTKQMADYTGIIVNGVDFQHHWYIAEAIRLKANLSGVVDQIFALAEKYNATGNLMCFGLEKFALEKALQSTLTEQMEKRKIFFPIKEIETDTRVSKEVRIRALQPRFQSGSVFIRRDQKDLYQELVMHPQLKHDDLIDALKSQVAITFPSPYAPKAGVATAHLTQREQKIWADVDTIAKRKVRQTKGGLYDF